jgi:hypothetical protein
MHAQELFEKAPAMRFESEFGSELNMLAMQKAEG